MRKVVLALALCLITSAARASPVLYVPGSGPPNVIASGRDVNWSEPPDLNGVVVSSEQILAYGFESEVANDFVTSNGLSYPTWWGAFWNTTTPCTSGMITPGFNLRVYEDAGCVPGATIADVSVTNFGEESIGCQSGSYPMFRWFTSDLVLSTPPGTYWFSAQMKDHVFPPRAGRLASAGVVGCESVLRSAYLGYPDWTPVGDALGVAFDASQEFIGGISQGACCLGDQGECVTATPPGCEGLGGEYQGDNTFCSPVNPCHQTADVGDDPGITKHSTTWGRIKGSYR